jgi:hypothetical protein
VDEYGYKNGYADTGSSTLANGKLMVVVGQTKTAMSWDNIEYSYTASVIDWAASTLSVEDLLPWVAAEANAMNAVVRKMEETLAQVKKERETKMTAVTTELETAKAKIVELEAQLASTSDAGVQRKDKTVKDTTPPHLANFRRIILNRKAAEAAQG